MWEAISEGDRAARVCRVLDEIADALAGREQPATDLALFWSYFAQERDDAATAARAARAVDGFVAELERGYQRPGGNGYAIELALAEDEWLEELA